MPFVVQGVQIFQIADEPGGESLLDGASLRS
jgi:hypothetical protein